MDIGPYCHDKLVGVSEAMSPCWRWQRWSLPWDPRGSCWDWYLWHWSEPPVSTLSWTSNHTKKRTKREVYSIIYSNYKTFLLKKGINNNNNNNNQQYCECQWLFIKRKMYSFSNLLFRILRMWLVCQLLVYRYQVSERDLKGKKLLFFTYNIFIVCRHPIS